MSGNVNCRLSFSLSGFPESFQTESQGKNKNCDNTPLNIMCQSRFYLKRANALSTISSTKSLRHEP